MHPAPEPLPSDLPAAPEVPVRLEADGRLLALWLCTPHEIEALAAGWLVCEGFARDRSDIGEIRHEPESLTVHVSPSPSPVPPLDPGFRLDRIPPGSSRLTQPLRRILTDDQALRDLFREMFERCVLRAEGGGMHAGGLVRNGSLLHVVEDVGRQNVVDKLVGWSVLRGDPPAGDLLLSSGRISGSIAAKAWRSGLAAVASLSIPTTLARDLARHVGVTLVGRAARGTPQVHWPDGGP